ncbi:MAG: FeoB-associated Cys-rich membrane protein [Christensenellales bacterium]|jgi:hypothetical protein
MLALIKENLPDIIALAVLAGIVLLVVLKMVSDKRKGKSGCACGCTSCPHSEACGQPRE